MSVGFLLNILRQNAFTKIPHMMITATMALRLVPKSPPHQTSP